MCCWLFIHLLSTYDPGFSDNRIGELRSIFLVLVCWSGQPILQTNNEDKMYAPPAFTEEELQRLVEAEVTRRLIEQDELAAELELHDKTRSGDGNFYWMRVEESEKRMIERMRRSQRIIRERGNSIVCDDESGRETGLVDDIPDAMAGIDEKDVAEKLHQLESMKEANEAMRTHIITESELKAELEQELEKREDALAVKELRETEWLKEQSLTQEREVKFQHDLAVMREALEAGIQREADARTELQFHRESLSAALQRENDIRTASDHKDAALTSQLHDATKMRREAEVREATLQRQLQDALDALAEAKRIKESSDGTIAATSSVSLSSRPSSLKRELSTAATLLNVALPTAAAISSVSSTSRPSSLQRPPGTVTTLFDVVFPDQASLGLVIVPHELQYDPVGNIGMGIGSSPSKALPTSLRPLGEEPIIDCCMVTSSSVAHCVLPGDILLSVNGERLVSNRIDELHTEKHHELHFNKVFILFVFFLLYVFSEFCITYSYLLFFSTISQRCFFFSLIRSWI